MLDLTNITHSMFPPGWRMETELQRLKQFEDENPNTKSINKMTVFFNFRSLVYTVDQPQKEK